MKKENLILHLTGIWIVILMLSGACVWLLWFFDSMQSLPLHAALAASGSIIAFFIAFFLFQFDNDPHVLSRFHFASVALIAMGIFELFHAISDPGSLFVWLHAMGQLFGALLFLSVFLSEKKVSPVAYYGLPILTAAVSTVIVVFLLFHKEILPPAMVNGHFATTEIFLNNLSSLLYFLAALAFVRHYRLQREPEDLYFIGLTLMLGSAAFLFQYSALWEAHWWYWHFLWLGGLFFVLLYFIHLIAEKNKNYIVSREIESSIVNLSADAILNNITGWDDFNMEHFS